MKISIHKAFPPFSYLGLFPRDRFSQMEILDQFGAFDSLAICFPRRKYECAFPTVKYEKTCFTILSPKLGIIFSEFL